VDVAALRSAVTLADGDGDRSAVADALDALASGLVEAGDYERAARLLGGAEGLRGDPGAPRAHAVVEEALGTVRLAELTADGRRLPYAVLLALALD
jgi:hypothetical protein